MSYQIKGKTALISGGASGIGLTFAKELLKNGLRGVALADINKDFGQQALQEIRKEFGDNKALYVRTDVTNIRSYEDAFKRTIDKYKNLDILINNAGILNDAVWEKEIELNIKGVIHGILLGLENYIPKYSTDSKGVIVNMSSTTGVTPYSIAPIYSGTKFAVMAMSKAFGDEVHYNVTKVKVVALCPGATDTPLFTEISRRNLGPRYQELLDARLKEVRSQKYV